MIRLWLVLVCALCAHTALAQEYVSARGKLSDDAFYRLVSCAAPPGKECQKQIIRWARHKANRIKVGITVNDPDFPAELRQSLTAGIKQAIKELNSSGARLQLRFVTRRPDIQIMFRNVPPGATLSPIDLPGINKDIRIEAAHVHIWWNNRQQISRSTILFTRGLSPRSARSVALEELTQAMGLLTDIRSKYYNRRSIFSQDSNATTTLKGQDLMVLRRHYPKR